MILSSEELSMCKDEMELQFMAKKLDKKDWFGSSGMIMDKEAILKTYICDILVEMIRKMFQRAKKG